MKIVRNFWVWIRAGRRNIIITIVVALVVLVGGFRVAVGSRSKAPQYQTAGVTKGTIVSSVSASGQILTSNLVNISTQATGVVKGVYVKNGDWVNAGQKIADITLDSDSILASAKAYASLVSAQNGLNSANNNYRSTQATLAYVYDQLKGHDTDETFAQKETRTKAEVANDNAYDAIKTAEANLTSASLSYRVVSPIIVAPSSGKVDNITITPGLVLSSSSGTAASNRVAVIRFEGNPIATFNVSEVDVNRIKPGQKATITLDSIPDKTFTGKVLTVDKIGTVVSGVTNYPVVVSFDAMADEILPNMAATANIIIESKSNVFLVPSDAVQVTNGESAVQVLRNGQVQTITVVTGLFSDTQTEITSGLSEGDEVITGTVSGGGTSTSTSPFSTFRIGGGTTGGAARSLGR